jgi:long-chain acyl-CoA synthetase
MKWRLLQFFGKPNALTEAYDSVIFGAIRDITGGRLQYGISGGAPVSFETQKFITSSLCYMLQGYGYVMVDTFGKCLLLILFSLV